ncbi:aldehyde dehydrogenase family protein [Vibrio sp. SCSIO 43140]|uniref:aldehyde dehydrogenase family protein n=1 Tax=Vibrio sp. SCSIO 43140 TaxID=2819100 RepID=UPI002076006C|nr:aldehyde dehydrogenase family protein [Vibrio sp. SCSIO 43140]USD59646.1 aldehyde dehydrogenase family protein [Vibrio sp. SCSIO 43140]
MQAKHALESLNPQSWSETSAIERLSIIEEVQNNLLKYTDELGKADADMKCQLTAEGAVSFSEGVGTTVNAMGNTLLGIRHLYESLVNNEMPSALSSRPIDDNVYAVEVYPQHKKDKLLAGKMKGYLHVRGMPKQTNPLDKPSGIIAVSGAGNYSSSIEMAMALFLENKAVIHKPHQLNEATDKVWELIFEPLITRKALAFIDSSQGKEMASLEGLHSIYFTGSTNVAKAIQSEARAPLVSECGGNNPCIIVPGEKAWTDKELNKWAVQIASVSKLNGGAVCGRPQTIITSKNWNQRDQFLDALRKAIEAETFATTTYYPGSDRTKAMFIEQQPTAEVLKPESGVNPFGDFVFIPNIKADDFAISNEAFCQVLSEIPLDTEANAEDFLSSAVEFCNDKLLGSLGCMILVDNHTLDTHRNTIDDAVHQLNYGGIAVNNVAPNIWLNAYLTWGGCGETTEELVSGVGNFGNALNFDNVIKSVIIDDFNADTFALTNKKQFEHLLINASKFSVHQTWGQFMKLAGQMILDSSCKTQK